MAERLGRDRLDDGERVLDAVIQFADQSFPVLIGAPALGHVPRDLGRADDPSRASLSGDMVNDTQTGLPSLRCRTFRMLDVRAIAGCAQGYQFLRPAGPAGSGS